MQVLTKVHTLHLKIALRKFSHRTIKTEVRIEFNCNWKLPCKQISSLFHSDGS